MCVAVVAFLVIFRTFLLRNTRRYAFSKPLTFFFHLSWSYPPDCEVGYWDAGSERSLTTQDVSGRFHVTRQTHTVDLKLIARRRPCSICPLPCFQKPATGLDESRPRLKASSCLQSSGGQRRTRASGASRCSVNRLQWSWHCLARVSAVATLNVHV